MQQGKYRWEAVAWIPADQLQDFEYKFFSLPGPVFERGNNRISDATLVEQQRDVDAKVRVCVHACLLALARVRISHVGVNPKERMHKEFGPESGYAHAGTAFCCPMLNLACECVCSCKYCVLLTCVEFGPVNEYAHASTAFC